MTTGKAIAVFVIPIAFSFIYGGVVLALSLQNPDRSFDIGTSSDTEKTSKSIQITDLRAQYSTSDQINARVSVGDPAFDCGDLYLTIYDVSTGQRKAVKQGAFFDQCYGTSGMLPTPDNFSERIDVPGKYLLEAQIFDKNGDRFLTASQQFSVQ